MSLLAQHPVDPADAERQHELHRDDRGRLLCPVCGGGLYMPGAYLHRCRVCEAQFVEIEEETEA